MSQECPEKRKTLAYCIKLAFCLVMSFRNLNFAKGKKNVSFI